MVAKLILTQFLNLEIESFSIENDEDYLFMDQIYEELMKDYLVPSEYINLYLNEFSICREQDYSYHRSKFMQFLRECVIDYDFFIHAALVKYNDQLFLIIGDKGCGKTSSSLYLYENGGEVFTDEFVYFKNNKIYSVGRKLALDEQSIENYFPNFKKKVSKKIKSKLNVLPKYMLNIDLSDNHEGFNHLDKIIILIPQNNSEIYLTKKEKYKLIEKQFFVNEEIGNVDVSKIIDTKIEIMMISEVEDKFYNEKN